MDSLDRKIQEYRRVQESKKDSPLSVSAALSLAKGALESVSVRLVGEVSEVSVKPGYKAAYFTVKDTGASLPCMMWLDRYRASGVSLEVGQLVELIGRFSLFAKKGRMNFTVSSLALAGEGMLRMQVAAVAKKLEAEGLTDPLRKRKLTRYPESIGVVTSPRGAAVHDVLRTLRRRYPLARIAFAGVPVEGERAAEGLIRALERVSDSGVQMVLLVRGGGSFEDLMPFNDEALARAIAECPVPVITGIGHEPDTTIADMVADVRASTPTAAAETAAPDRNELKEQLGRGALRLEKEMQTKLDRWGARIELLSSRALFTDSDYLLSEANQRLDYAARRLPTVLPTAIEKDELRLGSLERRLQTVLSRGVASDELGLRRCKDALTSSMKVFEVRHVDRLESTKSRFERLLKSAGKTQCEEYTLSAVAFEKLLRTAFSEERRTLLQFESRMKAQSESMLSRFGGQIGLAAARLHDLSPLAVLGRGYAIAKDGKGVPIKTVKSVEKGDEVAVMLSDGELKCTVESSERIDTCVEDWSNEHV